MSLYSGREREVKQIRQANRAAAVGRLMLGEFDSWHTFLQADAIALENLPRRQLKSGRADVKARLSTEIKLFCSRNFQGMNENKLSQLYEEIKAFRGLEMPLAEFEQRFALIKPEVLKGQPKHLTISISLWGLQFKFPEGEITKDLIEAIQIAEESQKKLDTYERKPHLELKRQRDQIGSLMRRKIFAARSVVITCFNLMEAYLNGLAWDFVTTHSTVTLSNNEKKLLEETTSVSIREKLQKYPKLLTGKPLWEESDQELEGFISTLKPFRDSLMHPSPFSAPAKFGGYDKLRLFYRIDYDTGIMTANLLVNLIKRIHQHIYGSNVLLPAWLNELDLKVKDFTGFKEK